MELHLSSTELSTLMEMAAMAGLMLAVSQQSEEVNRESLKQFFALEAKIMDLGARNGFKKFLEFNPATQSYAFSRAALERSSIVEILDEFREEIFWEELVIRLSDRELIKVVGQEAYEAMPEEERRKIMAPLERAYWAEFTSAGLDNLMLITTPNA